MREREGNHGRSYWENDSISINSMGLPNKGYQFYVGMIRCMLQWPLGTPLGKPLGKPCFLSIANINNIETGRILAVVNEYDHIQFPEINVSCPNISGKEQLGYNLVELKEFLDNHLVPNYNKPFGLKLPPYFDPKHIADVSSLLGMYEHLKYITCVNSVGNVLDFDISTLRPYVSPKKGLGGLGGSHILPIALANVYQFKQLLPHLDIIGCGGVSTGEDVFKHIYVGASLVQIGTTLNREGVSAIDRIKQELEDTMLGHGYRSIEEFKGKYI